MSPKKTRNLEQSRKEILDVAFWHIFKNGFQGTSIDDLVKQTPLTKGAFYHQFPTKLNLGYAVVDEVIKPLILSRWITPLDQYDNPLKGILTLLQKHIGDVPVEHLRYGCPLNNLVQEMAPLDRGFESRLKLALNLWIDEMERHLVRGKKNGFIKKNVNAKEVAYFVVMAHEGFFGMIKGLGEPSLFKSLLHSLKIYFDSISVDKP